PPNTGLETLPALPLPAARAEAVAPERLPVHEPQPALPWGALPVDQLANPPSTAVLPHRSGLAESIADRSSVELIPELPARQNDPAPSLRAPVPPSPQAAEQSFAPQPAKSADNAILPISSPTPEAVTLTIP